MGTSLLKLSSDNIEDTSEDQKLQKVLVEKEKTKYGKIDEHFERSDLNGDGALQSDEIKLAINNYMELNPEVDLNDLLGLIDDDENIRLKKREFRKLMMSYLKEDPDYEDWIDTFQIFDKNLSGGISSGEIRYVFSKLGLNISNEESSEMIKELNIGSDGDGGHINIEDFLRVMLSN